MSNTIKEIHEGVFKRLAKIETIAEALGLTKRYNATGQVDPMGYELAGKPFDPSTDWNALMMAARELGVINGAWFYNPHEKGLSEVSMNLNYVSYERKNADLQTAFFEAVHAVAVAVLAEKKEVKA